MFSSVDFLIMLSLHRSQTTPSRGKFALRAERRKGAQATRRHLFSLSFSWPLALRDELLARFATKVRYEALNCGSRQVHSGSLLRQITWTQVH